MTSRLRFPHVAFALSALTLTIAAAPSARAQEPIPLPPPPEPRTEVRGPLMIAGGSVLTLAGTIGAATSAVILAATAGSDVNYTGICAIGLGVSSAALAGGVVLIVFGARAVSASRKPPPPTAKLLVSPSSVGVHVSF